MNKGREMQTVTIKGQSGGSHCQSRGNGNEEENEKQSQATDAASGTAKLYSILPQPQAAKF